MSCYHCEDYFSSKDFCDRYKITISEVVECSEMDNGDDEDFNED